MAPLPEERVNIAGPFQVKRNGRADHKVWVAVFTCMVTRSVHTEIEHKIDATSMINAIVRFSARRPGIKKFWSDNGTNFTAAAKILKEEMKKWAVTGRECLMERGLEWEFIPSGTPHYGGVWERIVGLFKRHLTMISSGDVLQIDTFATILVDIEAILNKRPLTAMSSDPSDPEPITPSHILYPATFAHSSATIIPDNGKDYATHIGCAWKRAQARIDAFWRIWSKDYLSLLHNRSKWQKEVKGIEIGDIVIIVDESTVRNIWKTARVVSIDNFGPNARKYTVKRNDGRLVTKDRTKLVHLEIESQSLSQS